MPCQNCRLSATECAYSGIRLPRGRRPAKAAQRAAASSRRGKDDSRANVNISASMSLPSPVDSDIEVRLQSQALEQRCKFLEHQLTSLTRQVGGTDKTTDSACSNDNSHYLFSYERSAKPSRVMHDAPCPDTFARSEPKRTLSFLGQFEALEDALESDYSARHDRFISMESPAPNAAPARTITTTMSPPQHGPERSEGDEIMAQMRLDGVDQMSQCLDTYFTSVHSSYPCVNETHMRSMFAAFLANDSNYASRELAMEEFAALLNLIMAVAQVASDTSSGNDDSVPGYQQVCRAERLLNLAAWQDKPSLTTIQAMLVKSLYHLYTLKLNAAYATIGAAVRLCFSMGLHRDEGWGEDSLGFYGRTYRQRTFWCLYCLNSEIAHALAVPDLFPLSSCDVGLPACVDDRMLYPGCSSLYELPRTSPVPYLLECVERTKSCSEMWDELYSHVSASKPISSNLVARLDNKILQLSQQAPGHLRWSASSRWGSGCGSDELHAFVQDQSLRLYLLARSSRLRIRRQELLSLNHRSQTGTEVVQIAAEIITAVELGWSSTSQWKRTERYTYVVHLAEALLGLICVTSAQDTSDASGPPAHGLSIVDLFERTLRTLDDISTGFYTGRQILHLLDGPVRIARGRQAVLRQEALSSVIPTPTLQASGPGPRSAAPDNPTFREVSMALNPSSSDRNQGLASSHHNDYLAADCGVGDAEGMVPGFANLGLPNWNPVGFGDDLHHGWQTYSSIPMTLT
ncbi:hypothetical protein Z517_03773 [Fonsecaea pedrosoi CBS 271.37]|uniref:Xylanolytic transcriptional activator regulatory domain-containing protein n=1 Tax=Fonsecaea pedrosoi CBS 271.37 TaxID=1442368 RepID=A0A0D2GU53_9EURO|nr:uncharacterized protein Z517_03773 [Fonsecaea pedrosoi CBS 271.37]KIW84523.1 hypothetical protein Z517_03773 [Fonsecaea pedrosoi CBS 271.37]